MQVTGQGVSEKHRLVTANALILLRKHVLLAKTCVQTVTIASFQIPLDL